jgi:hypothetical protein
MPKLSSSVIFFNFKTTKCFDFFKIQFLFYFKFIFIIFCLNKPAKSLTMQNQQQQNKTMFKLQIDNINNPQPCPDNPIKLLAQYTPQYIYSPYVSCLLLFFFKYKK